MARKRVRKWLTHAIAICFDCGWREEDYNTAQKKARKHAKKTGHMVSLETAYGQVYNPKEELC